MEYKENKSLEHLWFEEEKQAHIKGWDFSHIYGRYEEEGDLPWDFYKVITQYRKDQMALLDMDTGGGEFLLSLKHPIDRTTAIEGYPPNVAFCKEKLVPLGVTFKEADAGGILPFEANSFDIITNRHGDYQLSEVKRLLKKGGLFLTQQVGSDNDRELIELLDSGDVTDEQRHDLARLVNELKQEGFDIIESGEAFRPIVFYDVGALVWFAKIISWEFPHFSVASRLEQLYRAQEQLEKQGKITGQIHRFYVVAALKED